MRAGAAAAAAGGPPGGGGGALVTSFSVRRSFSFEANAAFGSSASLPMATTDAPWMRAAAASSSASPPAGLTWILIVPVSPMASSPTPRRRGRSCRASPAPRRPPPHHDARRRQSPPPPFPSPSPFSSPPKNHFDIQALLARRTPADAVIAAVAYSVEDDGGAEGRRGGGRRVAIAADDFCFFNDLRGAGDGAARRRRAGAGEPRRRRRFLGGVGFVAPRRRGRRRERFSADLGGAGGDDFPFALVGVAVPAGLAAARASRNRHAVGGDRAVLRRDAAAAAADAVAHRALLPRVRDEQQSAPTCAAWPLAGEGARAACFASATFLDVRDQQRVRAATAADAGLAVARARRHQLLLLRHQVRRASPGCPSEASAGWGRRGAASREPRFARVAVNRAR